MPNAIPLPDARPWPRGGIPGEVPPGRGRSRRAQPGGAPATRVIAIVLDGLRPDAIPLYDLPMLGRLVRQGAATLHGTTVAPSVTAAAMTSLLTGATPERHGMRTDRFRLPVPAGPLHPMPRVLADHGIPARAWMASIPRAYRSLAGRLAPLVGFESVRFHGDGALEILEAARGMLRYRHRGLFFFHWPDADRAGHASGWPSPAYARAARALDDALARLDDISGASSDPETLLVLLADHGGGGRTRRDHNSDHPRDRSIPIVLLGGAVRPCELHGAHLLDVPATILHALGVPRPSSYSGRPLVEAWSRSPVALVADRAPELLLARA